MYFRYDNNVGFEFFIPTSLNFFRICMEMRKYRSTKPQGLNPWGYIWRPWEQVKYKVLCKK
jgi:hypothetical protein